LVTREDVEHVALLGRLELTEEENFQALQRLDTGNIQPTAHVLPLKNVYREDWVGQHMPREDALANCPDRDENYFKVPKIV